MKSIRFKEASTLLLIMLIILGTDVIRFGLSPQIPVLFVIALLIFWVKLRVLVGTRFIRVSKKNHTAIIPSLSLSLLGINRCLDSLSHQL